MRVLKIVSIFCLAVGLMSSTSAFANSPQAACFYTGANWTGARICVDNGNPQINNFSNFAGYNDNTKSVALYGGARVYACEHANFGGRCTWIDNNIADLGQYGWANVISSIRMDGGYNPPPPPPPYYGGEVCFHTGLNFSGATQCMQIGQEIRNFANIPGFNDATVSISIRGRANVLVCVDSNFRGNCTWISNSVGDLRQIGWSNTISSARAQN